ncbi:transglutaminase domain-containing protein [Paenibacillus sp. GCM10012307]|uniref:Transglutaminase n=1 Tax=Paenibacillus roseus TaxID=2798579 RepID=A0A934IWA5_9BACL|nr:transglutaminase domain-containing protein [Paenibacillus roseus]MBJ6360482.1 transglutaminase [Paenibacillus roseus]
MRRKLTKWTLMAIVILVGLGTELKFESVFADSSTITDLNQLSDVFVERLATRTEEFAVTYSGDKKQLSEQLPSLLKEATEQDDYTAYIVDSYFYTLRTWRSKAKLSVVIRYRETLEETEEVNRQVSLVLKQIISPRMSAHEKVKVIHDWLVSHLEYDTRYERYTAYEALKDGRAVCQGYTLLAYKMLNEAGIPAKIVEGTVATGDHAWNLVLLNGIWYHLDVTWDDSEANPNTGISYSYYLQTDKQMRPDHSWTKKYPKAYVSYLEVLENLQKSDPTLRLFYQWLKGQVGKSGLSMQNS